jgi:hypothetical protein
MGASRLSLVHVEVAGNLLEITWDERTALLDKLSDDAGSATIIERFWAGGASLPVVLDDVQRSRLRLTLELWGVTALPDGLARLLVALVQADPGGDVGQASLDHKHSSAKGAATD